MSQYWLSHGNLKILYGWDDPLRYFFLVITEVDNEGHELRPVFSNLDLPEPGMSIEQIKWTLADHRVPVPEHLERDLKRDELSGALRHVDSPLQSMMKRLFKT